MVLLLDRRDVASLLPMRDAVETVEESLRSLGEGRAENRPRERGNVGPAVS